MNGYMIFSSSGNAIDVFETFESAAELLVEVVEKEPEAKDELIIIEFDKKGHAINAFKHEDLL